MDAIDLTTGTTAQPRRVARPVALWCAIVGVTTVLLTTIGGTVGAERTDPAPAAADAPSPSPLPQKSQVAVIGDSITFLSEAAIHTALDPTHDVVVNGIPGIKVLGQLAAAREAAHAQPGVVVINLGTNDVLSERDPADVISDLDDTASLFGPATCVVFVNLTTFVTNADFQLRARAVNRWIDQHAHVADWNRAITEGGPNAGLTTDTVHPTEHGQVVMARLIQQQVNACGV
jgi:lysophospholipase L1-like esterase